MLKDPYVGNTRRARVNNVQSLRSTRRLVTFFLRVAINHITGIVNHSPVFSRATAKQIGRGQNQRFDYFATVRATRVEVEEFALPDFLNPHTDQMTKWAMATKQVGETAICAKNRDDRRLVFPQIEYEKFGDGGLRRFKTQTINPDHLQRNVPEVKLV
jgi:hypothetical protein